MSFVGAAIVGGVVAAPLIGGKIQADAAHSAADTQAQSAREANALQEKMYNQTRADQEPWRAAGTKALSSLGDPSFQKDFSMSDYQADPGYAFRMQQGQQALDRSAAAKGGLMSGGALKGISRFGQDMASQEYGNAYNRFNQNQNQRFGRLSQIAGMGQGAANQVSGANQGYAAAAGGNIIGAGNAQAAGTIGAGNAWAGAAHGIADNATGLVKTGVKALTGGM